VLSLFEVEVGHGAVGVVRWVPGVQSDGLRVVLHCRPVLLLLESRVALPRDRTETNAAPEKKKEKEKENLFFSFFDLLEADIAAEKGQRGE